MFEKVMMTSTDRPLHPLPGADRFTLVATVNG